MSSRHGYDSNGGPTTARHRLGRCCDQRIASPRRAAHHVVKYAQIGISRKYYARWIFVGGSERLAGSLGESGDRRAWIEPAVGHGGSSVRSRPPFDFTLSSARRPSSPSPRTPFPRPPVTPENTVEHIYTQLSSEKPRLVPDAHTRRPGGGAK